MAVTPNLKLELFAPLGVGWREDATAGALLDYNMMLIDAASQGGGSVASVFGRTGIVAAQASDYSAFFDSIGAATAALALAESFATSAVAAEATARTTAIGVETSRATAAEALLVPKTTAVNGHALSSNVVVSASDLTTGSLPHAQLPALVSGDIPNIASQFANLPNVKMVPIYSVLTGGPFFDFYTVPAGRRAIVSSLALSNPSMASTAAAIQIYQAMVKVSGVYYQLTGINSPVPPGTTFTTGGPVAYIAEAGETMSMAELMTNATFNNYQLNVTSVAAATTAATFTLTAASVQVNGLTTYTGTITAGSTATLTGIPIVVTGFTNAGNNGTFICVAATTTTITVINAGGVAETHAGSATYSTTVYTVLSMPNSPANQLGALITITGCTNAANNGTFVYVTTNGTTTITLANAAGVLEASAPSAAVFFFTQPLIINGWVVEFDNTAALKTVKLLAPAAQTQLTLYTPSGSKNGLLVGVGNTIAATSLFASNGRPAIGPAALYYIKGTSLSSTLTSATTVANGLTTYKGLIPIGGGISFTCSAATAMPASYVLSAAAATSSGNTVYTGTFAVASTLISQWVTITGFTNAGNNGTFYVTANSTTTLTVANIAGIAETHAGTATVPTAYTVYTVAALTTPYVGLYFTVAGMATANNGTFQCIGGNSTTQIYLRNTGGSTQTAVGSVTLQPLYGQSVTISGFANAGNNGTFTCVGSTLFSLTLSNTGGIAETHAGAASCLVPLCPSTCFSTFNTPALGLTTSAANLNMSVANGDSLEVMFQQPLTAPQNGVAGLIWCNVVEF